MTSCFTLYLIVMYESWLCESSVTYVARIYLRSVAHVLECARRGRWRSGCAPTWLASSSSPTPTSTWWGQSTPCRHIKLYIKGHGRNEPKIASSDACNLLFSSLGTWSPIPVSGLFWSCLWVVAEIWNVNHLLVDFCTTLVTNIMVGKFSTQCVAAAIRLL